MHACKHAAAIRHIVIKSCDAPDRLCNSQAYYKQYNNLRPKYLENIWKVVNWADVNARLEDARSV